jgi:hypothetical protein
MAAMFHLDLTCTRRDAYARIGFAKGNQPSVVEVPNR